MIFISHDLQGFSTIPGGFVTRISAPSTDPGSLVFYRPLEVVDMEVPQNGGSLDLIFSPKKVI